MIHNSPNNRRKNTITHWWRCSLGMKCPCTHTHTKFNHVSAVARGNTLWKPHYSGKSPFPCYFTEKQPQYTHTHILWLHWPEKPGDQIFLTLCGAELTPSCLSPPEESARTVTKTPVPQRVNVILWQWRVWCCEHAQWWSYHHDTWQWLLENQCSIQIYFSM